jgi:DNA uptake protein ComE-like DNA-binding protein
MKIIHRLAWTSAAAALALALAACGGSTTPTGSAAAAAPTGSTGASNGTGSSGSATTVSANTASEEEIAAALESAGVSNAQKWAHEVVEYRPYPADDADLTALRDELVKYNPGQETTDKIVSALSP